ncbi:SLATT domain-containing protein [Cytobacillus kochii]|uniref:SLATT domain-containing protein n=1 Tax=Cytobacillus kochii TaxID=859143 RepID=UPI001CD367D9|nr:SLATT domain-containing protein [Cytobacillus kochii]MCA1029385.1 SLATT domain-containing protein [Cytobacillus kochii]
MIKEKKELTIIDIFYDLKRRVSITRKARIKASKRLRRKHEFFEKVTNFYSLIVLILSVWFINYNNLDFTKGLLILSLSLTFFTMFLSSKNYKERAGAFETNYQHLDVLLNKIERIEVNPIQINTELVKKLHREYEILLIEKENHHDIDYMTVDEEMASKFKIEIATYRNKEKILNTLIAIYPIILFGFLYFVQKYL